jgi:hypothetical protein
VRQDKNASLSRGVVAALREAASWPQNATTFPLKRKNDADLCLILPLPAPAIFPLASVLLSALSH